MKITGELLKTERLKQELKIQDIASSLKLSSKIISSIEAGDIENLPPKTFVRGFVKNYAQLIKLDVDMVLRQFQEEMGSTNPLPKISPPLPVPREKNIKGPRPALKQTAKDFSAKNQPKQNSALNQNENSKKIIFMVSIAVVLIIFLVISNKVVDNLNTNPIAIVPAIEKTPPSLESNPETTTPKPTEMAVSAPAKTEPSSLDQTATPTPLPTPLPAPENITASETTPEVGFEKSSGKPVELLVEAKKDTELFYARGDSKQFISLKLTAKQIQILRSNVGLYLKAADGASFKISVNGVEKGMPTGENKAIKLTF